MPFKITIWLHGLTKLPGWPCTVHPSVPALERVGTTELLCCIWHPQTLKLHMAGPRVCSPYTLTNELPHSAHAAHVSPAICCAHSPCCLYCPHDLHCLWCPYLPCYSSHLCCLSCSGFCCCGLCQYFRNRLSHMVTSMYHCPVLYSESYLRGVEVLVRQTRIVGRK